LIFNALKTSRYKVSPGKIIHNAHFMFSWPNSPIVEKKSHVNIYLHFKQTQSEIVNIYEFIKIKIKSKDNLFSYLLLFEEGGTI